jgi:hypothetical protein
MLLEKGDFQDFKDLMGEVNKTFNTKVLVWFSMAATMDRYGEDPINGYIPNVLFVGVNYNYMRNWPATVANESGKDDKESTQVLINKQWLRDQGFLTPYGYFNFKPDDDLFVMDGLVYRCFGDTASAQSGSDDILITLILRREPIKTGDTRGTAMIKLAAQIAGTIQTDPDGFTLLGGDGQPLRV